MNKNSLSTAVNNYKNNLEQYAHFIAIDWAQSNVALARMKPKQRETKVIEWDRSDLKAVKEYLFNLKGKKILTIEETTSTHWLYVELKDVVDRIVICDPYRNHLLSYGPKNDKIDSKKLCMLLKGGLLNEVFHTCDKLYDQRQLLSAYVDLVKAGTRMQNQRSAVYRSQGMKYTKHEKQEQKERIKSKGYAQLITDWQDRTIDSYFKEKVFFESEIRKVVKGRKEIKNLTQLPGIAYINAFKISALVVDPHRFVKKGSYLAYCGLVWLDKISGNRSYGKRRPRYNRQLKGVYKNAARIAIDGGNNPAYEYYQMLTEKKKLTHKEGTLMVARYLAKVSLAMMKSGKKYDPYRWRKDEIKAKPLRTT